MCEIKEVPKTLDILNKYQIPTGSSHTTDNAPRLKAPPSQFKNFEIDLSSADPALKPLHSKHKFLPNPSPSNPKVPLKASVLAAAQKVINSRQTVRKAPPPKPQRRSSPQRKVSPRRPQQSPPPRKVSVPEAASKLAIEHIFCLEIPRPVPDQVFTLTLVKKPLELPIVFVPPLREYSEISVGVETEEIGVGNSCRDQAFQVLETPQGIVDLTDFVPEAPEFSQQVGQEEIKTELSSLLPHHFSLQVDDELIVRETCGTRPQELQVQTESEFAEVESRLQHGELGKHIVSFDLFVAPESREVQGIREKVKNKETLIELRRGAATQLQALYRAYRTRKGVRILREKYRKVKRNRQFITTVLLCQARNNQVVLHRAIARWVERDAEQNAQVYELFQNYSALRIQSCWRGFRVRKPTAEVLKLRKYALLIIQGAILGHKTRSILRTQHMRLLVSSQSKRKFLAEFTRLYYTGIWTTLRQSLPIAETLPPLPLPESPRLLNESPPPQFPPESTEQSLNREEIPLKPLQSTYIDIAEQYSGPVPAAAPSRSANFLRKGASMRYDPLEKAKQDKAQESLSQHGSEDAKEPKFYFLKRTSKTYVTQKLDWKVSSRVDCWTRDQAARKATSFRRVFDNSVAFNMLEEVFEEVIATHVDSSVYLSAGDREEHSCIPQFSGESFFITHYTDEIYQEMQEALDNHYNYLCSDEFATDQ